MVGIIDWAFKNKVPVAQEYNQLHKTNRPGNKQDCILVIFVQKSPVLSHQKIANFAWGLYCSPNNLAWRFDDSNAPYGWGNVKTRKPPQDVSFRG